MRLRFFDPELVEEEEKSKVELVRRRRESLPLRFSKWQTQMKNTIFLLVKLALLVFFSLIWFILIQVEYEIITKPELQDDFPFIKGSLTVYINGIIVIILSILILLLVNLVIKSYFKQKKNCIIVHGCPSTPKDKSYNKHWMP
jgi:hypothetical protein